MTPANERYKRFSSEMARAKEYHGLGRRTDYWMGYMRGLRRNYHGSCFGSHYDHLKWLDLINDDWRDDLGKGYRDGLYLKLEGGQHYEK